MRITIRPERVRDYHRIAEIHALAFTYQPFMSETLLVDLHRHRADFDPELSLVAEADGEVIGHALFQMHHVRVGGEMHKAAALAPIAVHPDFQKRGAGGMLMEEGHKRAAAKGCQFVFLLGHTGYYPRFGYQTGMFGTCHIKLKRSELPASEYKAEERRVEAGDLPELTAMWEQWFEDTDLALFPGRSITDWITTSRQYRSSVVTIDGRVAGYVRYEAERPENIRYFLAKDQKAAAALLAFIDAKIADREAEHLEVPVHPDSAAAKRMIGIPYESETNVWEAAMIKILNRENRKVVQYCREVSAKARQPGMLIWPVEFDLC